MMASCNHSALAVVLLASLFALTAANVFEILSAGAKFAGDATYYGYRTRGFGHCSFHMHGFGDSKGYAGTPLAINAPQYQGTRTCGLCVKYRGVGQGLGGNPVSTAWQGGFICDSCPECKFGDLDQQMGGDGRWKVEWYPVQCPVGSSKFRFGFQGGNPWYRKMMVANARVPIKQVRIWESGAWKNLISTIDNYWEYHGDVSNAWQPCAKIQVTSILGDTVTDQVCCKDGQCSGRSQLPCRSDYPSDDCKSTQRPVNVNVGGIGDAAASAIAAVTGLADGLVGGVKASISGGGGALSSAVRFGRGDLSAARVPSNKSGRDMSAARVAQGNGNRVLQTGQQCGGKSYECGKFGKGACQDKKFPRTVCAKGLKCKRNDANWWGCSQ